MVLVNVLEAAWELGNPVQQAGADRPTRTSRASLWDLTEVRKSEEVNQDGEEEGRQEEGHEEGREEEEVINTIWTWHVLGDWLATNRRSIPDFSPIALITREATPPKCPHRVATPRLP
jgi:hypothetical protein